MKETAIIICNYNKADYVLKCIETVLASDYQDFELYVVDNASTDGSVQKIREKYTDQVMVLQNAENLGGSGGFNTGLRKAMEGDYRYVCCLDNDVQVTPGAIGALRDYLKEHPEVGIVGSKVCHLQQPEYVQQMGLKLHFDTCSAETLYADVPDSKELPEVVDCDTVAACSLMMPMSVLREVGPMPEDNFIYWDDMEWGYRVTQRGYRVAAIAASKVYHEMSANIRRETTFATYYLRRNSLHFFMRYTPEKQMDSMCFVLLRSVFDAMYESLYREEHQVAETIQYAFFDALQGIRGKAADYKIRPNDGNCHKLLKVLKQYQKICIQDVEQIGLQEMLLGLVPELEVVPEEEAQIVWRSCRFVMTVPDTSLEVIYVDGEGNVLADEEDAEAVRNYVYSLQLFIYMHQHAFYHRCLEERGIENL